MASKVVLNTHTFNNGFLEVEFKIQDYYADSGITIDHVVFEEFDTTNGGEYVNIDDGTTATVEQSGYHYSVIYRNRGENHLVKCTIYVDPTPAGIGCPQLDLPCCAVMDCITDANGNETCYWVFEEYFVDLYAYEKSILDSINLGCEDNCNVPISMINSLLKLFTVKAAVDVHSPQMEMIYSKIGCNQSTNMVNTSFTRNCNCNG